MWKQDLSRIDIRLIQGGDASPAKVNGSRKFHGVKFRDDGIQRQVTPQTFTPSQGLKSHPSPSCAQSRIMLPGPQAMDAQKKKDAQKYRIDLSLIEHNLSLTYEERIWEHQRALDTLLALQEAGRAYYAKLGKSAQDPRRK